MKWATVIANGKAILIIPESEATRTVDEFNAVLGTDAFFTSRPSRKEEL